MYQELDVFSTGTIVEKQTEKLALQRNYEQWVLYNSQAISMSINSVEFSSFFEVKKLSDLPETLYDYITML